MTLGLFAQRLDDPRWVFWELQKDSLINFAGDARRSYRSESLYNAGKYRYGNSFFRADTSDSAVRAYLDTAIIHGLKNDSGWVNVLSCTTGTFDTIKVGGSILKTNGFWMGTNDTLIFIPSTGVDTFLVDARGTLTLKNAQNPRSEWATVSDHVIFRIDTLGKVSALNIEADTIRIRYWDGEVGWLDQGEIHGDLADGMILSSTSTIYFVSRGDSLLFWGGKFYPWWANTYGSSVGISGARFDQGFFDTLNTSYCFLDSVVTDSILALGSQDTIIRTWFTPTTTIGFTIISSPGVTLTPIVLNSTGNGDSLFFTVTPAVVTKMLYRWWPKRL